MTPPLSLSLSFLLSPSGYPDSIIHPSLQNIMKEKVGKIDCAGQYSGRWYTMRERENGVEVWRVGAGWFPRLPEVVGQGKGGGGRPCALCQTGERVLKLDPTRLVCVARAPETTGCELCVLAEALPSRICRDSKQTMKKKTKIRKQNLIWIKGFGFLPFPPRALSSHLLGLASAGAD